MLYLPKELATFNEQEMLSEIYGDDYRLKLADTPNYVKLNDDIERPEYFIPENDSEEFYSGLGFSLANVSRDGQPSVEGKKDHHQYILDNFIYNQELMVFAAQYYGKDEVGSKEQLQALYKKIEDYTTTNHMLDIGLSYGLTDGECYSYKYIANTYSDRGLQDTSYSIIRSNIDQVMMMVYLDIGHLIPENNIWKKHFEENLVKIGVNKLHSEEEKMLHDDESMDHEEIIEEGNKRKSMRRYIRSNIAYLREKAYVQAFLDRDLFVSMYGIDVLNLIDKYFRLGEYEGSSSFTRRGNLALSEYSALITRIPQAVALSMTKEKLEIPNVADVKYIDQKGNVKGVKAKRSRKFMEIFTQRLLSSIVLLSDISKITKYHREGQLRLKGAQIELFELIMSDLHEAESIRVVISKFNEAYETKFTSAVIKRFISDLSLKQESGQLLEFNKVLLIRRYLEEENYHELQPLLYQRLKEWFDNPEKREDIQSDFQLNHMALARANTIIRKCEGTDVINRLLSDYSRGEKVSSIITEEYARDQGVTSDSLSALITVIAKLTEDLVGFEL